MTVGTETQRLGFVHSALIYHSEQQYLDFAARFVDQGLAMNEAVLVAVPAEQLASLRDALCLGGGTPEALRMADITEVGRNPSRFMAMVGSFVDEYAQRRVRVVSQLAWPGRSERELLACVEHEALLNGAMDGYEVTGLCLYDGSRLEDQLIADVRATHPLLWQGGALHRSADYAPGEVLQRCNRPLAVNAGAVTFVVRGSADLRPARSFVADYAGWMGLCEGGIDDLQLIATELATNSLMYSGGACRLALWRDGEHLVCEARDGGWFDDPLVGRLDPGPDGPASRGLYLVNAISDLVRTHTGAGGTTIQAYLPFDPAPGPNG